MSRPITQFAAGRRTVAVDLPHLAFATAIAAWCAWFCWDAWRAQRDVENLIMIVPASAAALGFYAVVAASCFRVTGGAPDAAGPARRALAPGIGRKIAGTMALLAAYAITGPTIGFDVASFVYVLLMLLLLGERRVVPLVLVPTVFCVVVIYSFATILSTPLPLLLFPDYGS